MTDRQLRRVPTGINGFDRIALGGLPAGRSTLVTGTAGSGKSLFAIEFLARGIAEFGEPGVFVTFEESPEDIRINAYSLGFDVARWEAESMWMFVDASLATVEHAPTVGTYDLGPLLARIEYAIRQVGARRASLDPLGGLFGRFSEREIVRREMLRIVLSLQASGVVSILTAEKDDEYATTSREGVEEFVAANVVTLRNTLVMQKRRRTVEIVKFRGAEHRTGEWLFAIDPRDGIVVIPLAFAMARQRASRERISSGNTGLDRMCGGGFFRDAMVLVTGPTGAGKTLSSLQFTASAMQAGERCLLCSFDETRDQLGRNAASWGLDLDEMEASGLVQVVADYPETTSLEAHFLQLKDAIMEFAPARFVIDTLSALERIATGQALLEFVTALGGVLRGRDVTSMLTAVPVHVHSGSPSAAIEAASITDVTIRLLVFEAAGRNQRAVSIVQTRGSAHDEAIRRLSIDDAGMRVGDPVSTTDLRYDGPRLLRASADPEADE